MTEWVRRENGAVVEIVMSHLPDEEFLLTREGQDLVHVSEVPFSELGNYIQEEAARLGQPPRPLGLVQPPIDIGPQPPEETEIV